MTDQNRKTLRSFYCRDYLWELFEQMTHELGCSMDYLINESMRLYARSRDFSVEPTQGQPQQGGGFPGQMNNGMAPPPAPGGGGGFNTGAMPPAPPRPQAPVDRFNVGQQGGAFEHRTLERMPAVGNNRPTTGGFGGAPLPPAPPAPGGGGGFGNNALAAGPPPPPPRPSSNGWQQAPAPGPPPGAGGFAAPGVSAPVGRQNLYLTFHNNRYTIDKDKFVIGRGSQQTDLTIRDGNISRKHCAVIYHNGSYYIKDLGSTNGIEYRGNRIESKKIDEGDVFYLCDYELRFSYH